VEYFLFYVFVQVIFIIDNSQSMNLYLIWYEQEVKILSGCFIVPIKRGKYKNVQYFHFFPPLPGKIYK